MTNLLLNIYFLPQLFIYCLLLYLKKSELALYANVLNYLSDFLCLPIILTLSLWALRIIIKHQQFNLSKYMVAVACLYFSVVFEGILPIFYPSYTADIFDVLMYAAGGCFFYFVQMPELSKT